jgi:hypothetical protein
MDVVKLLIIVISIVISIKQLTFGRLKNVFFSIGFTNLWNLLFLYQVFTFNKTNEVIQYWKRQ